MLELSNVGIFAAFAAGTISFLSPCVLPLVPGYLSYIAGTSMPSGPSQTKTRSVSTLFLSVCFTLGFSTVFIALGASASALSRLLLTYHYEANLLGGGMVILFGLFMTGLIRPSLMLREIRFHEGLRPGGPAGAYALGLAFGFGWTPCIGPVLGAILTVSALPSTASSGVTLLAIYSLGLAVPFLVFALFTDALAKHIKSMRQAGRLLQVGAGAIMVAMGFAMITGQLSTFSFWLMERLPILSRIG